MFPITPPSVPDGLRISDLVSVSRLLNVPTGSLDAVLAGTAPGDVELGSAGRLRLTTQFAPPAAGSHRRIAVARLYGRGPRLVRYARIEIEVAPWSWQAAELRILPVSRSPHAWGLRRLRRYLALSQLAADALERRLSQAARRLAATPEQLTPAARATPAHESVAA